MPKYSGELIDALKRTTKKQIELNDVVFENGSHQALFDAALACYEAIGQLIETLEDQDENMDPEKTKLPDLDEVFAGDPASEYVDALIAYKEGTGTVEAVNEAAKRLADFQNGVEPVEEEEIYDDSIEGFAKAIVDHNNVTGVTKTAISNQIVHCFELLKGQVGPSVGFKAVTEQGVFEGTIYNTVDEHIVKFNGKEYSYTRKVEEKPVEVSLGQYVTEHGFGDHDPMALLDTIQEILDSKGEFFSKEDYKLIRFYLKQKPFADPEEIDTLSERALELAWKRFKYMRNVK